MIRAYANCDGRVPRRDRGSGGTVRQKPDTTSERDLIERGVLRLHYVGKPIGYERYTDTPDAMR